MNRLQNKILLILLFFISFSSAMQIEQIMEIGLVTMELECNDIPSLHSAVLNNHITIAKFLIDRYPQQLNSQDVRGNTPLHTAVLMGRINIIKLLLHNGASLLIRNKNGQTPIKLALEKMNGQKALYSLCTSMNRPEIQLSKWNVEYILQRHDTEEYILEILKKALAERHSCYIKEQKVLLRLNK
jgi:ankyrin repeat protein